MTNEELDKLIVTEVMKAVKDDDYETVYWIKDDYGEIRYTIAEDVGFPTFHPTTDLKQAWECLVKFCKQQGYTFKVGKDWCEIDTDGWSRWRAYDDSVPMAIIKTIAKAIDK